MFFLIYPCPEVTGYQNEVAGYQNEVAGYQNEVAGYQNEVAGYRCVHDKKTRRGSYGTAPLWIKK